MPLIAFEYITFNEQLLSSPKVLYVDPTKVLSRGEQTKPAYDSRKGGSRLMKGFFIEFNGDEYGSVTITEAQFFALLNSSCCSTGGSRNRIHVRQFIRQFR